MKRLGTMMGFGILAVAQGALAAETVTYSYDALGRLTGSVIVGGPNNGTSTGTSFDPAGNRSGYSVTGSTAALEPASYRHGPPVDAVAARGGVDSTRAGHIGASD